MKKTTIVLLCAISLVVGGAFASSDFHWKLYKARFGKEYPSLGEDSMRKSIFLENKREIEKHNAELAPKVGYSKGINQFSDWTRDELAKLRGPAELSREKLEEISRNKLDASSEFGRQLLATEAKCSIEGIDWRKVPDRVSEVVDQGKGCAADWAFVATGLLEGQLVAKFNRTGLIPLSKQNLIDCAKRNETCESGGLVSDALKDIYEQTGINAEVDYPYEGAKLKCRFQLGRALDLGFFDYTVLQEDEFMIGCFLFKYGPVAAAMDPTGLEHYKSGIYTGDPQCKQDARHATKPVLIVGYGRDKEHGFHYIIKNTWGKDWGEQGYFRMAMYENTCGIAKLAMIASTM